MPTAPVGQAAPNFSRGLLNLQPQGQAFTPAPAPPPAPPNNHSYQLTPDILKSRIVAKYPDGISSDGQKYADMNATELTQKIVSKFPNGVTSDGHKYSDFLPAPTQPGNPIADFAKSAYSGIASPVLNMIARPGQAATHLAGDQTAQSGDLPIGFGATAHINDPYEDITSKGQTARQTLTSDVGRAVQTVALGLGPVAGGASFGAGSALEQNKPFLPSYDKSQGLLTNAGNAATGNVLGSGVTGAFLGKAADLGVRATGSTIKGAGTLLKTLGSGSEGLYNSAQKNIERVLVPTTKSNKLLTEKLAPQAAKQGLPISLTRNSLLTKLNTQADNAGTAIDTAWAKLKPGSKVDVKPILASLNKEANGLRIEGPEGSVIPSEQQTAYNQLQTKIQELASISDHQGMADAQALRAYRQSLDEAIAKNKSASFAFSPNDTANMAGTKLTANTTRNQIAKQVPGVAGPNKAYNFYSGLGDILDATITRKTGQGTPLGEKILEGAGAAGGFASHGLTGGIEYAVLAKLASKVVSSTAWQTASAAAKKNVADAISAHDAGALGTALKTGFNLAGTGLEHVGNFIKGIPGATKDLPQRNIPGTSAAELKAAQPGLSMKDVTNTPEFKDAVSKALHEYDTTPSTVNGKPDLANADAETRIAQLQDIVNKRALTTDETKEAYSLLGERGLDPMKPRGVITPRPLLSKENQVQPRHPTTQRYLPYKKP